MSRGADCIVNEHFFSVLFCASFTLEVKMSGKFVLYLRLVPKCFKEWLPIDIPVFVFVVVVVIVVILKAL